jgi:hypothetical protein
MSDRRARAFGSISRDLSVAILQTPHFTVLEKWARGAHFV